MKTIIAILFALFSTCTINAQTTYTLDQLVGTKWRIIFPERIENDPYSSHIKKIDFSLSEIHTNYKRIIKETGEVNANISYSKPYYLSNSIPASFDKTKVGKVQKGSYIILYNNKINRMEYFYIKTLTKDKLVLYHKRNYKDMDDDDCTAYFERVK